MYQKYPFSFSLQTDGWCHLLLLEWNPNSHPNHHSSSILTSCYHYSIYQFTLLPQLFVAREQAFRVIILLINLLQGD